ncbi:MAG: hypothetical protein ACO28P_10690, partial [Ilumatobacteraceae bacterium]
MNVPTRPKSPIRVIAALALLLGVIVTGSSAMPAAVSADPGEATGASTKTAMSRLASGNGYSCRVITGGHITCWGRNVNGQLGIGSTDA